MKKLLTLVIFLGLIINIFSADLVRDNTDFRATIYDSNKIIYSGNLEREYTISIQNKKDTKQFYTIKTPKVSDWRFYVSSPRIGIEPKSQKEITIRATFLGNLNDYIVKSVKPNTILYELRSLSDNFFVFDISIDNSRITENLKPTLLINKNYLNIQDFYITLDKTTLSIFEPLVFNTHGLFFDEIKKISKLETYLDNVKVSEVYRAEKVNDVSTKFFFNLSNDFYPKQYELKIVLNFEDDSQEDRILKTKIEILPSSKLKVEEVSEEKLNLWQGEFFEVENIGNVKTTYIKNFSLNFFSSLFLEADNIQKNEKNEYSLSKELLPKEKIVIGYYVDYSLIFFICIAIVFLIVLRLYIFLKNPLDIFVDTKEIGLEEFGVIKKGKFRVKIENTKKVPFKDISLIVIMPVYISIKEENFLISRPDKTLYSRDYKKYIWQIPHMKSLDTNIFGFIFENKNNIIGDLHFPEIQIRMVGDDRSVKKFYKKVPPIKLEK